jgi:hypothetical protein
VDVAKPLPQSWVLRAVDEEGKAQLQIESGEDRATCENLVLTTPGGIPVHVSVAGKQVQVSGPGLQARCDSLTRVPQADRILMTGHVRLAFHQDNFEAEVEGNRVVISMRGKQLELKGRVQVRYHNEDARAEIVGNRHVFIDLENGRMEIKPLPASTTDRSR